MRTVLHLISRLAIVYLMRVRFNSYNTAARKKFITFSAVPLWNNLPIELKDITSFVQFKKTLFSYIISTDQNHDMA